MKKTIKLLGIIAVIAMIVFSTAGCAILSDISGPRLIDEANGNWATKTVIRKDTVEAELMVRVGDIDTLNTNLQSVQQYGIFEDNRLVHSIGWELDRLDPRGTDRIYVGTAWTGSTRDGYSQVYANVKSGYNPNNYAVGEGALEITMEYGSAMGNITVKNARLDIAADDFQSSTWGSNFTVTLNGVNAPFIAAALNNLSQTGPICELVKLNVPTEFLPAIQSGTLVIKIDESTGVGDGYAVDFVRLLVNLR
jgi:hypothetical protein